MEKCLFPAVLLGFALAAPLLHAEPKEQGKGKPAADAAAKATVPTPEEEAAMQEVARPYAKEKGIADKAITAGLKKALWKEDKQAVAMCFQQKSTATLCLVLVLTAEKKFT